MVSGAVLVMAAVGLGFYLSRGPWLTYREQRRKADLATMEMRKSERQKNDLLQQQAMLETPLGKEQLARGKGYLKSGEQALDSNN